VTEEERFFSKWNKKKKKDFLHGKNFSNLFEGCHNVNAKIIFVT
jgi:hypothetical protein